MSFITDWVEKSVGAVFGSDVGKAAGEAVDSIGDTFSDAGDALEKAAEGAAQAVEDAAEAVGDAADSIADAASELAEGTADVAEDVGDWIDENSEEIGEALLYAGKVLVTAATGPIGAIIVGAGEGAIKAGAKGGDPGDVLKAGGIGALDGAATGNPIAEGAVDFVKDVDKGLDEGKDLGDAITGAAENQDLDPLLNSNPLGNSPLYEAGVHAGVAAANGEDAASIGAAGVEGFFDGWIGDTVPGKAIAGGAGGFADGLFHGKSDEELLESTGKGAWDAFKGSNPGLDLAGELVENFVAGKPIDQAFIEAGKKGFGELLEDAGVDKKTAEKLTDIGLEVVDGLSQGKSADDVLLDVGKDLGKESAHEEGKNAQSSSQKSSPLTTDGGTTGIALVDAGDRMERYDAPTDQEIIDDAKDDLRQALERAREQKADVEKAIHELNEASKSGDPAAIESATEKLQAEQEQLDKDTDALNKSLDAYEDAKADALKNMGIDGDLAGKTDPKSIMAGELPDVATAHDAAGAVDHLGQPSAYPDDIVTAKTPSDIDDLFAESSSTTGAALESGVIIDAGTPSRSDFGLTESDGDFADFMAIAQSPDVAGTPTDIATSFAEAPIQIADLGVSEFDDLFTAPASTESASHDTGIMLEAELPNSSYFVPAEPAADDFAGFMEIAQSQDTASAEIASASSEWDDVEIISPSSAVAATAAGSPEVALDVVEMPVDFGDFFVQPGGGYSAFVW